MGDDEITLIDFDFFRKKAFDYDCIKEKNTICLLELMKDIYE